MIHFPICKLMGTIIIALISRMAPDRIRLLGNAFTILLHHRCGNKHFKHITVPWCRTSSRSPALQFGHQYQACQSEPPSLALDLAHRLPPLHLNHRPYQQPPRCGHWHGTASVSSHFPLFLLTRRSCPIPARYITYLFATVLALQAELTVSMCPPHSFCLMSGYLVTC